MNKEKRLLNKKQLSEKHPALKNLNTIDWMVRTKKIPHLKIGRLIFFEENMIDKWIDENSIKI